MSEGIVVQSWYRFLWWTGDKADGGRRATAAHKAPLVYLVKGDIQRLTACEIWKKSSVCASDRLLPPLTARAILVQRNGASKPLARGNSPRSATDERLVLRGRKLSKSRKVVSQPGFWYLPSGPACAAG